MKKDAYDQYIGLINQFKNDPNGKFNFNEAVLPEAQSDPEIVFVCKNYNIEGGLSHRLHNAGEDLYQVKALMGKSLNL